MDKETWTQNQTKRFLIFSQNFFFFKGLNELTPSGNEINLRREASKRILIDFLETKNLFILHFVSLTSTSFKMTSQLLAKSRICSPRLRRELIESFCRNILVIMFYVSLKFKGTRFTANNK